MEKKIIAQIKSWEKIEVTLYSDTLVIDRSTASRTITLGRGIEIDPLGKGKRTIPLRSIQAVTFQEGKKGIFINKCGVLDFDIPGSNNGQATDYYQAKAYDPNRIMFEEEYNSEARKIKDYIEEYLSNPPVNNSPMIQQTSAADELRKFKELLDMGVITQAEFDAKKKQLLGL